VSNNLEKYKKYITSDIIDKITVDYQYEEHTGELWFTFFVDVNDITVEPFKHAFYYDQDLSDGSVALFRGNTSEKQYMTVNNKFRRRVKEIYACTNDEVKELWNVLADVVDGVVNKILKKYLESTELYREWVDIRFTKFPRSSKITVWWEEHKSRAKNVATSGCTITM
jgi:hypothetical protein